MREKFFERWESSRAGKVSTLGQDGWHVVVSRQGKRELVKGGDSAGGVRRDVVAGSAVGGRSSTMFVENIPVRTSWPELCRLIRGNGVVRIYIARRRRIHKPGLFGFVEIKDERRAGEAVEDLNGAVLCGAMLQAGFSGLTSVGKGLSGSRQSVGGKAAVPLKVGEFDHSNT